MQQTVFKHLQCLAISKAFKPELKGILGHVPSMQKFSNHSNQGPVHQSILQCHGPTSQPTRSNSHYSSGYSFAPRSSHLLRTPIGNAALLFGEPLLMSLCLVGQLPVTKAYTTPLSLIILYTLLASRYLRFSSYPGAGAAPGKSRCQNLRSIILHRHRRPLLCDIGVTHLLPLVSMPVLLLALLHHLPLFILLGFRKP